MDLAKLNRPEPAAGVEAYREELAIRLAKYPACADNWQRYHQAAHNEAVVDYLPVKLDVENVSRCNFACTMCAVSKWPKRQRAQDMSFDAFRYLIDEQIGLVEIKLNGLGEATMQGDPFFQMIQYARSKRIWVRITTNASLLHLKDNYKKLIDSGVNEVDISVDGADAPTFEGIRIGGNFVQVANNCRLLNDYAASQGKPSAKMWTLVQRGNAARLAEHVALASRLGFKHMVFSLQLHGWGSEEMAKRNAGEMVSMTTEDALQLTALGEPLGVRVAFWDVSDKFEAKPGKRCPWPFSRAVVTSDLRTVACCMIGNPDEHEFGRNRERTFLENWQGREYHEFRQAHLDGEIPAICRKCYAE